MKYNEAKTKKYASGYYYFTCQLCSLSSRLRRQYVDPKNPTWHIPQNSHREKQKYAAFFPEQNPRPVYSAKRKDPASSSRDSEHPAPMDMSDRAELAEKVLVMIEDIKTLGLRRIDLVDLEKQREEALKNACELVKKCKQECLITRGEILEVDKREKELAESVPELVRALAASK